MVVCINSYTHICMAIRISLNSERQGLHEGMHMCLHRCVLNKQKTTKISHRGKASQLHELTHGCMYQLVHTHLHGHPCIIELRTTRATRGYAHVLASLRFEQAKNN